MREQNVGQNSKVHQEKKKEQKKGKKREQNMTKQEVQFVTAVSLQLKFVEKRNVQYSSKVCLIIDFHNTKLSIYILVTRFSVGAQY